MKHYALLAMIVFSLAGSLLTNELTQLKWMIVFFASIILVKLEDMNAS